MTNIQNDLFEMKDENYKDFQCKLMPTVLRESVIGIRTPLLRKYAKSLAKDKLRQSEIYIFLKETPHQFYEENNLHGWLLPYMYSDINVLLEKITEFLPFVNNWATCDSLAPKIFKKHSDKVYEYVKKWLNGKSTYEIRFGIVVALGYFLDENYKKELFEIIKQLPTDEYYINMASAWYFSFALIKQYDDVIPLIQSKKLNSWVHNKAIQKAIESYQISPEKKEYLRTLKVSKNDM